MVFFSCPGTNHLTSERPIRGTRIECTWDGRIHDYTRKQHIVYSQIMLPPQAPRKFHDRATLWNSNMTIDEAGQSLGMDVDAI